MVRGSFHQEDITVLSMYEAHGRAKNMEARTDGTETEIHKYTIIVEDFNTFLSVTVRTTN